MPRPPPPAEALISTGKPIRSASSSRRAGVLVVAVIARDERHARARCISALAAAFEPIARIAEAGGPMNTMPGRLAGLGEFGILRQEAVAGMHRLGAAAARRVEDRRDVQIALPRRRGPDRPCLVGELDMQRVAVGLGIDRDGRDPEPPRGADHPAGDFAAIGDQDLAEQAHIRKTPKRVGFDRAR